MSNSAQQAPTTTDATNAITEQRMPELIDETLARLTQAGVERMLDLAALMAQARLQEQSPHLVDPQVQRN